MTTPATKAAPGLDLPAPARAVSRLIRRIRWWLALSSQRRALAELDDRALKDLGLDRETAAQEAARWFFDDDGVRR